MSSALARGRRSATLLSCDGYLGAAYKMDRAAPWRQVAGPSVTLERSRMKLGRWAAAGASAYVIYKYTSGKKAQGESVFVAPPEEGEDDAVKPARAGRKKK